MIPITLQIALACFIGGSLGYASVVNLHGYFRIIGLFAGMGLAYLAYDFRNVPKAAFAAYKASYTRTAKPRAAIKKLLLENHPYERLAIYLGGMPVLALLLFLEARNWGDPSFGSKRKFLIDCLGADIMAVAIVSFVTYLVIAILSKLGSNTPPRSAWFLGMLGEDFFDPYEWSSKEYPTTMSQTLVRMLNGVGMALYWVLYLVPTGILLAAIEISWLLVRILRHIHGSKRVLCAMYSGVGIVAGYTLHPAIETSRELLTWMICSGVIGAVLGVLSYQLISIRLLKLSPTSG